MRVTIGMRVFGECGSGVVVAMTREWCIYDLGTKDRRGMSEVAEPWDQIAIEADPPDEPATAVTAMEVP